MSEFPNAAPLNSKLLRTDGQEARTRLLDAALTLARAGHLAHRSRQPQRRAEQTGGDQKLPRGEHLGIITD